MSDVGDRARRLLEASGFAGALRHRDLRRLFGALLVSGTGSWAYNVALIAYVYQRTGSLGWVAAAGTARYVGAIVASPAGGWVADRYERVRVLVASDILSFVFLAALTALVAARGPALGAIALAVAAAMVGATYGPATTALLPHLAGEDDLASANALNGLLENLVAVLGPAIGAGLIAAGSTAVAFGVNAGSFALSALLVVGIRGRAPRSAGEPDEESAGFRAGLAAMTSSPVIATVVGFSLLASFLFGVDTILYVAIGTDKLGLGSNGFGVLLAGCGAGGVVAAPFIDRLSRSPRLGAILLIGIAMFTLPTLLQIPLHSSTGSFFVQLVRGAGTMVVDVLAVIALQRAAPNEIAARVFGVFTALVLAAIALGSILTSALVEPLGLDAMLVLAGAAVPALCLLGVPALRQMDRVAAVRVAELAPRVALLRTVGPFIAAPQTALERLAAAARERTAVAGEAIVREGDPADAFYVLVEGAVDVSARGEAAAAAHIRSLGPGEFFGELGLLGRTPRTATVTASAPCRLLEIDGETFLGALSTPGPARLIGDAARVRLAATHPSRPAPVLP